MSVEKLVPESGSLRNFIEQFPVFAAAPNGISSLRETILQLAVSGKLSLMDSVDGSVDKLISEASANKLAYEEKLKLRKAKAISGRNEDDFPFEIPRHWRWCQLDDLACYIQRGKGPKYSEDESALVVSQKCIQWNGFDVSRARGIETSSLEKYKEERFLVKGDLLWNSTGTGTVGRVVVLEDTQNIRLVADSHVTVIRLSNVVPRYIWCFIACPWVQSRINPEHEDALVSGSTKQVELSTTSTRELPIPLPPIEEQKRIVAKVDELMALCDKLEVQQQQQANTVLRANTAAINALLNPAAPETSFEQNWQRITQHFNTLYGCTLPMPPGEGRQKKYLVGLECARKLKQLILRMACSGLLVDSSVFPDARSDLKTIGVSNIDCDGPNNIPNNWSWVQLSDLSEYITSGSRGWKKYSSDSGDTFIRSQDIKYDKLLFEDKAYVSLPDKVEGKRTKVSNGDILITITGANVGKCALINNLKDNAYVSQHVALVKLTSSSYANYLHKWIINEFGGRHILVGDSYGDKPGLNLTQVGSLPVPFPSLEEQKRIVSKVDELMAFCDQLEQQLTQAYGDAEKLMEATVKALVA